MPLAWPTVAGAVAAPARPYARMAPVDAYLIEGGHDMAHVMFYVPFKDGADWCANLPGSPVFGGNYWHYAPEHQAEAAALPPLSVLLVAVGTWSDGTPAGMGK